MVVISWPVLAGGYRVSTQGQKALGMGHTGVAIAESPETVFFNPGATAELEPELQVITGLTVIDSKNRYQNQDTGTSAATDTPLSTPVNIYVTKGLNERLMMSYGLYTPYGSSVEWEKDWAGSHLLNNIDLQAIFLQASLAYEVNDKVSIGGGPIMAIGAVELNRNLTTSLQNADGRSNVTLEDSNIIEFGYNLGAFFELTEKLDAGINYRSEIIMESEGDAKFENIPAALATTYVNTGYKAELPLPAELTLGMAYALDDQWTLAADYNYTFWDVYENLTISFDNGLDTSVSQRNYKNTSTYRLGVQHQTTDKLQLRGGFYYDESPVRDGYFSPETPRGDARGFTAGMTWELAPNIQLDVSGLYLYFSETDNSYDYSDEGPFAGTYKSRAYALGMGLTYQF